MHSARLMAALSKLKLKVWPYPGAIGIVETDEVTGKREIHVVRDWCLLATVRSEAELSDMLETARMAVFDRDIYQLLLKHLGGKRQVIQL
jgi:DNA polymerase-3 subunit epsilon